MSGETWHTILEDGTDGSSCSPAGTTHAHTRSVTVTGNTTGSIQGPSMDPLDDPLDDPLVDPLVGSLVDPLTDLLTGPSVDGSCRALWSAVGSYCPSSSC